MCPTRSCSTPTIRFSRLRAICLDLPDAAEKISHGRVVWFTTKVFAVYGGKVGATTPIRCSTGPFSSS